MTEFPTWAFSGGLANMVARSPQVRASETLNVLDYGADPTGQNDSTTALQNCLNEAFGPVSAPHGKHESSPFIPNKQIFVPAGHYITSSALQTKYVHGAHIFGAGKRASWIENVETQAGAILFSTDGLEYSVFERLRFTVNAESSVCFEANSLVQGQAVPLQSNSWYDCQFDGGGLFETRGIRLAYGPSGAGFMGDSMLTVNCTFKDLDCGIRTFSTNAIGCWSIGCDFVNCSQGIANPNGSWGLAVGCVFHNETSQTDPTGVSADITTFGQSSNCCYVVGCKSTSPNFTKGGQHTVVLGCDHKPPVGDRGYFLKNLGACVQIAGCFFGGKVYGFSWVRFNVCACQVYGEATSGDWIEPTDLWWMANNGNVGLIELENIIAYTAAAPTAVDQDIRKQRIYRTSTPIPYLLENYVVA